ncbi:hypothetical protein BHE90_003555 [Fusarium euwallaceae]|uniref:Mid2 domain-containing protein n=2 Tax=Fusarium solani species complex TaxID=232080 RepID=A0A430M270_9HYPO|nr:hypothetical protein BHE90_003555 [Fusarium euwallaceae]
MRLLNSLRTAVFLILVGNTAVIASPAATATSGPQVEIWQAASDFAELRSGTLTITVAPDATCGYDSLDDPALCRANKITYACTSSDAPYCLRVRLGSGIIHYTCHSTIASSDITIATTRNFEEREFSTFVLVDGNPVSTISGPTNGPTNGTTGGGSGPPVGAIVGGVVGGVAVIGLVVLGVFGLRILGRRRSGNQATPSPTPESPVQEETHMPNTKAVSASSKPPELYG